MTIVEHFGGLFLSLCIGAGSMLAVVFLADYAAMNQSPTYAVVPSIIVVVVLFLNTLINEARHAGKNTEHVGCMLVGAIASLIVATI